jgi:hypothetical protein
MSAAAGIYLGFNGKVYYLTTPPRASWGTVTNGIAVAAAPTGLVEMTCVRDVNLGDAMGEADGTTRASQGYKLTLPALQELDIDLSIPWQPADAGFQILRAGYYARTTVALAILDGPSTQSGVSGVWADFSILTFPREEPEDKEMLCKVKIKPGWSAVPPQAVAVT